MLFATTPRERRTLAVLLLVAALGLAVASSLRIVKEKTTPAGVAPSG